MHVDLQKRFPTCHVCPKCLAPVSEHVAPAPGFTCTAPATVTEYVDLEPTGDTNGSLNIPSCIGCVGKDIGRLVTWEFPLRTDSASWKSLESFIQFSSFCSSCTLPDNSKIVFWSLISFRLASISNVKFWNFRNSSISVRLC